MSKAEKILFWGCHDIYEQHAKGVDIICSWYVLQFEGVRAEADRENRGKFPETNFSDNQRLPLKSTIFGKWPDSGSLWDTENALIVS